MIAGQSFNLLEAIYLVVWIAVLYLVCMTVLLNIRSIARAAWRLLSSLLQPALAVFAEGSRFRARILRHERRVQRHQAWMKTLPH